jgi:hypothetical protein
MCKILLDIDAEALVDTLIIVLVVEKDLAFLGEAGDDELWAILVLVILISVILWQTHLVDFVDLEDADGVGGDASLNEYLIVDELGAVLVPCLLLDHVRFDVGELLALPGPGLRSVVGRRQEHFDKSIELVY